MYYYARSSAGRVATLRLMLTRAAWPSLCTQASEVKRRSAAWDTADPSDPSSATTTTATLTECCQTTRGCCIFASTSRLSTPAVQPLRASRSAREVTPAGRWELARPSLVTPMYDSQSISLLSTGIGPAVSQPHPCCHSISLLLLLLVSHSQLSAAACCLLLVVCLSAASIPPYSPSRRLGPLR